MPELVAHQRDLVHEADVHGAERVLEQLHHLGDARRADRHDRLDRRCRRARAASSRALRRHAADDLRHVARVERRVARVDALGRERQEEVDAGLEAAPLEQRLHHFLGRPRIGGRLEHDQHARVQVRGDRLDRRHDERHVGILGLAQRRRHADVDRVELGDDAEVGGRAQPPGRRRASATSAEGTSGMYDSPRSIAAIFRGVEIDAGACRGRRARTPRPAAGRRSRDRRRRRARWRVVDAFEQSLSDR